jgi:hypothetical protein
MASSTEQPDLTVLEYSHLIDAINAGLDRGQHTFDTQALAAKSALTDAQVYEAMTYLAGKHEYINDAGDGEWRLDPVEE